MGTLPNDNFSTGEREGGGSRSSHCMVRSVLQTLRHSFCYLTDVS